MLKIILTHPRHILRLTLMPVKLDGEPQMAPTLLRDFDQKMIRNATLTI